MLITRKQDPPDDAIYQVFLKEKPSDARQKGVDLKNSHFDKLS